MSHDCIAIAPTSLCAPSPSPTLVIPSSDRSSFLAISASSLSRSLPSYSAFSHVWSLPPVHVFFAVRLSDDCSVTIRLLANFDFRTHRWRGPSRSESQLLRCHFNTLKLLDQCDAGLVTRPIEITQIEIEWQPNIHQALSSSAVQFQTIAMVTRRSPGSSLSSLLSNARYAGGFPLTEFFPIALQLCSIIGMVHHERHGLNLSDIVYDSDTGRLEIQDYGLPPVAEMERRAAKENDANSGEEGGENSDEENERTNNDEGEKCKENNRGMKGTKNPNNESEMANSPSLPSDSDPSAIDWPVTNGKENYLWLCCMSPEQTGRVYRQVDGRSDIYSVGMIFFILLTGKFPFAPGSDELELIHSIITKHPPSIHSIRSNIPSTLSIIVAKCVNKIPRARYQSVQGLQSDIARIYRQLIEYSQVKLGRAVTPPAVVAPLLSGSAIGAAESGSERRPSTHPPVLSHPTHRMRPAI